MEIPSHGHMSTTAVCAPMLAQNVWFEGKAARFERRKMPERPLPARAAGAYGTFTVTHDIARYTQASFFSEVGKKTGLFVRFSTAADELGAGDAARAMRGFAIKFYTGQGDWDLVGHNSPVSFRRDPGANLRGGKDGWDFWTRQPETLHQVTIAMSERGIPASYRHMHGFGSHIFSLVNARNERFWVKFHMVCQQGVKNLTDAEAHTLAGRDRESYQRDLSVAIEKGYFPRWKMCIQAMPGQDAAKLPYNPFDLTKVWYKKDYPLIEVGILELNRNPENYFAEVERVAFDPASALGYVPNNAGEWHERSGAEDDFYSQPGRLFRLMSPGQQQALFDNTARAMGDVPGRIKLRHIENCAKADPFYGIGVAKALGM